jgi:hypothetical protein
MSIFNKISKTVLQPIAFVGNKISKAAGYSYQSTPEELSKTTVGQILGTSIAATSAALVVTGSAAIAGTSAGAKIAQAVVNFAVKNPKTTIALGLTTLPIVSAISSHPKQTVKQAVKSVDAVVDFEKAAVNVVSGDTPVIPAVVNFVKEHPIAAIVPVLAIAPAVVPAILNTVSNIKNREATQENTAAINESNKLTPVPLSELKNPALDNEEATQTPLSQVTSTPEEIGESTPKKRKKKRLQPRTQTISQRVDVRVGVDARRIRNQKYINNSIYN